METATPGTAGTTGTQATTGTRVDLAAGFSLVNARACLAASAYAYQSQTDTVSSAKAHAAIVDGGNATIIAFRGTVTASEWIRDCEAWPSEIGEGAMVHHGFWDAFSSVAGELLEAAGWIKGPVFVTGHSLGGALAVLAARMLERGGFPVHSVYTFGGPRVGNRKFAEGYNGKHPTSNIQHPTSNGGLGSRTFRFVNEEDIVSRLPGWLMGYRHVGIECFLASVGGMKINPPIWFKAVSDAVGTYWDWKRGHIAQLADHPLTRYQERLGKL
jgi:triacylglycerol lipase